MLLATSAAQSQTQAPTQGSSVVPPVIHVPYYIDPSVLRLLPVTLDPPDQHSEETAKEIALLHQIEASRTEAEAAAAKADDEEEDIFVYRTVLGPKFIAANLPVMAAFSTHIHNEETVASSQLKPVFHRPRPYQWDKSLHPICHVTDVPTSYPSGHTTSGFLLGLTLAELVPAKRQQILMRADDYAHNRLICGVHYLSDLEASRRLAYAVFGYLMATPRFSRDLEAARAELRSNPDFAEFTK